MKSIHATNSSNNLNTRSISLDSIQDIDNQVTTLDRVLNWLDTLVEVHGHEENISN